MFVAMSQSEQQSREATVETEPGEVKDNLLLEFMTTTLTTLSATKSLQVKSQ